MSRLEAGRHSPVLRLVTPLPECPGLTHVKVHDFTEKKTDVKGALRVVRENRPAVRLGLVAPIASDDSRKIAADLKKYGDWSKVLSTVHLEQSQLPEKIPGTALRRPEQW